MNKKKYKPPQIKFSKMILSNKKVISPVVATALLLVVAVMAVVGFSGWFSSFQSGINSDVEQNSRWKLSKFRLGII